MAFDEEYRELIEDARDALRRLLDESEHDAWSTARLAYGHLRDALARDDRGRDRDEYQRREQERAQERERESREYDAKRDAWLKLDREVKKGRILSALGDDALSGAQIVERLSRAHPEAQIYNTDLVSWLKEMLGAGEVEREKVPRAPGCSVSTRGGYKWLWRRRRGVSPELRDLERRLRGA